MPRVSVDEPRTTHLCRLRRAAQSLGLIGCGLLLLACVFVKTDDAMLPVVLITMGYGLFAFTASGFSPVYLEICPAFSGQLYSISNTCGTVSGIVSPLLISGLVDALGKQAGWTASFALLGLGAGIPASVLFCRLVVAEPIPEMNQPAASSPLW